MKILAALLSVFACVSLNVFAQSKSVGNTGLSDEDYKVWAEILCSGKYGADQSGMKVMQSDTMPTSLTPEESTRNFYIVEKIREYYVNAGLKDTTDELLDDYNTKNKKSFLLEKKFVGCANYNLISEKDVQLLFQPKGNGWHAFYTQYRNSDGINRFTRVGLSSDKKQAIITIDNSCGWKCGSGIIRFYINENDTWVLKASQSLWVS